MIPGVVLFGERFDFSGSHWDHVYYGSRTFVWNFQRFFEFDDGYWVRAVILMFNALLYVIATFVPFYLLRSLHRWINFGE
jgi:hypothetical protein